MVEGVQQGPVLVGTFFTTCNPLGDQRRLPCHWFPRISMPLGMVTVQTGSTTAQMGKSAVSGDRPG